MQNKIYALPALQLVSLKQTPHNNLPAPLTPLIDREQEVEACCALLLNPEVRLVTLLGPGGIGKTRLGLQITRNLLDAFSDGVCFVSMATISDSELVLPTIAQALGIWETSEQPLRDTLKVFLREKHLLLLLDNFEQVITAASQLAELLVACPGLHMLVTSRSVLHIQGEHEFLVPPLATPDPKHLPDIEPLAQYAAVALFLQCARAITPHFRLTKENASAIAEICVCLDGLPLAIELAAARIKLLSPQALQARLDRRLDVLTTGTCDAPERHQTLRKTIAWSYDLLNGEEQRLFRQLSAFVGGCSLEAVEATHTALNGGNAGAPLLDRVASLLDKCLLQQTEQEGQRPRLTMLETIREFGQELLATSGDRDSVRQAHAAYYLSLVEEAERDGRGRKKAQWLMELQRDHDNIRAALRWLMEREESEKALSMGSTLWHFWWICGYLNEGRAFLEWALPASEKAAAPVRAKILNASGWLACLQGEIDRAEILCSKSLALFRELGDTKGTATALWMLGYMALIMSNYATTRGLVEEALALSRTLDDKENAIYSLEILALAAFYQGEYGKACAFFEESLEYSREIDDTWSTIRSLCFLALVVLSQGDLARAHALLEESLTLSREIGYKACIAQALNLVGQVILQQGDSARARLLMEESLELFKELGDQQGTAQVLSGLGWISFVQRDYTAAQAFLYQSLEIARRVNNRWFIALCLEELGCMVALQGQLTYTVRLLSVAGALCETIKAILPPVVRGMHESTIAIARAQLGEQAFTDAWIEGRTLAPEHVLASQGPVILPQAASVAPPSQSAATTSQPISIARASSTSPAGLTAREVEILDLVAQGLTDAQVASKLIISPRTVNWHLGTIYSKLGVSSRSAATHFALKHHLI